MARIQLRDTTVYLQDGLSGASVINDAGVGASGDTDFDTNAIVLNTDDTDLIPIGARFTIAAETDSIVHTVTGRTPATSGPTTNIVFTPATNGGVLNAAVVTFLPQRLQIAIGDGDLTWTEAREMIYDLDRDILDTVRQGADQPLEVDLAFTYEYVTTESGQTITPVDAVKRTGEASEWVSSSSDLCEPYCVDVYVIHCVPCGTDQDEDLLFQDFRYENLEYSIRDASISVSGRCNITDVVVTRSDMTECA